MSFSKSLLDLGQGVATAFRRSEDPPPATPENSPDDGSVFRHTPPSDRPDLPAGQGDFGVFLRQGGSAFKKGRFADDPIEAGKLLGGGMYVLGHAGLALALERRRAGLPGWCFGGSDVLDLWPARSAAEFQNFLLMLSHRTAVGTAVCLSEEMATPIGTAAFAEFVRSETRAA